VFEYLYESYTWSQLGEDIESDLLMNSVSMSSDGSRVAIGAPYTHSAIPGDVRVYEYMPDSSMWVQLGGNIVGEDDDYSGWSVSMSSDGSRVAVGAIWNDGAGIDAGHVRVYEYASGSDSWVKLGGDIDGEAAGDNSGYSLSMSSDGSRVAIGAWQAKVTGFGVGDTYAGHVRVYEYASGSNAWVQLGGDIDAEDQYDYSGWSVSMSSDGSRVAISALYNDDTAHRAGHVRVYEYMPHISMWKQLGGDIDGEGSGDYFGWSVSMNSDGSGVAVGAIWNNGAGSNAGHVRVYEYTSGSDRWVQLGGDIDGEAAQDWSGTSVSMSSDGTSVAIGAPQNDAPGVTNAGHVRLYEYLSESNTWEQLGGDIDGAAADEHFGSLVSLSEDGTKLAISTYDKDGGPEYVRVFSFNP